jgi:hypothetical protein
MLATTIHHYMKGNRPEEYKALNHNLRQTVFPEGAAENKVHP